MGNMFARRAGQRDDIPPIAMGSHLDTQPTGGKFDGVLGVLSALEALRTLHAAGYETFAPIEVANFTNEEGSRFAPAMIASGVFARVFERDYAVGAEGSRRHLVRRCARAHRLSRGPSVAASIRSRLFSNCISSRARSWSARTKTSASSPACRACAGMRRHLIGQEAHTGATPMTMRKNALLGAARMIEAIDAIAQSHAPLAVGTVGLIEVKPNSRNVVPGDVFFTVDFRHPESAVLDAMENGDACAHSMPCCRTCRSTGDDDAHLGSAAGGVRSRLRRAVRNAAARSRIFRARHRFRRRARRGLYFARRARRDGVRARARTASATTRRNSPRRSNAPQARRCCCKPCSISTGISPNGTAAKHDQPVLRSPAAIR